MIVIIRTIPRCCCRSHSYQTQFFMTLKFNQNIIIISISHNNRMSLYSFFAWIMLQRFLGISWTYLIVITSRHGERHRLVLLQLLNSLLHISVRAWHWVQFLPRSVPSRRGGLPPYFKGGLFSRPRDIDCSPDISMVEAFNVITQIFTVPLIDRYLYVYARMHAPPWTMKENEFLGYIVKWTNEWTNKKWEIELYSDPGENRTKDF